MQIYGKTLNFSYVGSNEKTDVYHVQFTIKIKLYGNEHATKVCVLDLVQLEDNLEVIMYVDLIQTLYGVQVLQRRLMIFSGIT